MLTSSRTVELTPSGLHLQGAGEIVPISGSIHYWRHEPAEWPRILDAFASTGLRIVDVYVPWTVHDDVDAGSVWSGSRDLTAFLRLIHDRGMYATARVGPHSGAELTDSGFPARVHRDPRIWALRCNGLPYVLPTATHHINVPSYFAPEFRQEVARWYAAMTARVAPQQWPDGPVVACQVDNEHGYFFQSHAYAMDYHPAALQAYRSWLAGEYGDIAALNSAYGTQLQDFAGVVPPGDARDQPERRRLDWVRWREQALRQTLAWLRGLLEDGGIRRVPFFHNDFPRTDTPLDQAALEQSGAVDVAAVDIYATRSGARYVSDLVRHAAGTSRLAWLAECGAGWISLPWLLPMAVEPLDTEFVAMAALLAGARATNFYMTVERERWYGSPIDRHGGLRPRAEVMRRITAAISCLRLHEMEREAPILLVENRAQSRRRAARATLGGLVPAFSAQMPFDFALCQMADEADDAVEDWHRRAAAMLRDGGRDHDRAVTSSLRAPARYRCVLVPSATVLDRSGWEALCDAAQRGTRVVVGPSMPSLDENLQPLPPGPLWECVGDPKEVMETLPSATYICPHHDVDVIRWHGGGREVVALLNHSAGEVRTELLARSDRRLRPVLGDAAEVRARAQIPVPMVLPPWSVTAWEGAL
ncbi:MAG: beta-galactosidase [Candidatus Dormibacteria bacterium]